MSGWASLPSVPDADLELPEGSEAERRHAVEDDLRAEDERPAGTVEEVDETPDLRDPDNRDNWRVENWRVP